MTGAGRPCSTATPPPTGTSSTPWPRPGSTAGRPARRGGRTAATSASSPPRPPRRPRATGPAAGAGRRSSRPRPCGGCGRRSATSTQHLDETVTLERLGRAVGLSPYHLQRTFKRITGVTPRAYAGARRMERMKSRLKQGDTVSRATYDAGYSSPSRAYDQSRARLGMTPGSYQRGGRGCGSGSRPCRHGARRGAGRRHRARALLGDPGRRRRRRSRRRSGGSIPAAQIERARRRAPRTGPARSSPGSPATRPSGSRSTCAARAFQWRVWEALQRIPRGSHPLVRRDRAGAGPAVGGAGGRARVRQQPAGAGDPVPPGRTGGRRAGRIPLGDGAEARAAGGGERGPVRASTS